MLLNPKIETDVTKRYKKYWIEDFSELKHFFNLDQPQICVFDSETTGLHIKKDIPFMWVFGWTIPKNKQYDNYKGRVFAFDSNVHNLTEMVALAKQCKFVIGHNVKFDLHMLLNGGLSEETVFSISNITDTMGTTRLSVDAVSARDGGDVLGLKKLAEKYIDKQAGSFESEVKKELRKVNDKKRDVLKNILKPYKGWGLGKIKDVYKVRKRGAVDIYSLERKQRWIEVPSEIEDLYKNWIKEYPQANYSEVDKEIMIEYVHGDGIYTLELFDKTYPVVVQRNQTKIFEQENKLVMELLRMERAGLKVDMEYLRKSYEKSEKEITKLYQELWDIVGEHFTVSQDQVIAGYYEKVLGERPSTTDKSFLKKHKNDRVAQLITRLRRLEKWQSTYISRITEIAEFDGRFYTQYGQFNTVSGRLGSDAQQFPKERILTEEGEKYEKEHGEGKAPKDFEIFYPRRAFVVDGGKYNKIAYFDLSQIELRVQANYTILSGRPDLNLCRAYMPYNCIHYKTGEVYNFKIDKERARWNEKQENGLSVWLLEDGTAWTPTDVHSETTHNTLVALDYNTLKKYMEYNHKTKTPIEDEKSFKWWRNKGKMFNFMRNYGGGKYRAMESLELDEETAEALVTGWSNTFPNVAYYQKMVDKKIKKDNYAINMCGRMYYLENTDKAYKVGNYLVQGSCADELKNYIIRIGEFLRENNCKTKPIANIHDEIQFSVYDGEEWIFPHIKRIMEDVKWMQVPAVVDLEITKTSWADKKDAVI